MHLNVAIIGLNIKSTFLNNPPKMPKIKAKTKDINKDNKVLNKVYPIPI